MEMSTRSSMSEESEVDDKMGLTGCGKFLKYSMFMFNAVILVVGCGILGFGVYTRSSDNRLHLMTAILGSELYSSFSLILIVTGGVVIVLAFLGCCGAIKEVKCMLGTFFFLLFMMLLAMIVGGAVVYAYKDTIGDAILDSLYTSLNSSYGWDSEVTEAWNNMQTLFDCCGVVGGINSNTSWAFYKLSTSWYHNLTKLKQYVPDSCCVNALGEHRAQCLALDDYQNIIPAVGPPVLTGQDNQYLYTDGCYTAVVDFLTDNVQIVAGLGAGVSVLMVLGMVFSLCLCRRIQDDYLYD